LTAEIEILLFCTYLNCDVTAEKIIENDVSVPLYFYFKDNFNPLNTDKFALSYLLTLPAVKGLNMIISKYIILTLE